MVRYRLFLFPLTAPVRRPARPGRPVWARMGPYGPVWAHMGPYGPIWAHMGKGKERRNFRGYVTGSVARSEKSNVKNVKNIRGVATFF